MGWIYFIRNEDIYKIGITTDLSRRMRELQPSEVIMTKRLSRYEELEKELHKRFSSVRIPQSEYFRLSSAQVEMVRKAIGEAESPKIETSLTKLSPADQKKRDEENASILLKLLGYGLLFFIGFKLSVVILPLVAVVLIIWAVLWSISQALKK